MVGMCGLILLGSPTLDLDVALGDVGGWCPTKSGYTFLPPWRDDGSARTIPFRLPAPMPEGEQLPGRGQAATLLGGEDDFLAARDGIELLSKDAPFFFDIVELVLRPIVDRGGDHHDDELQRH